MKKIMKLAAVAAMVFSFASCESFLDTTNYWSKDSSNFPVNSTDAEQMLAGIYNNLNVSIGNNVHVNHFLWSIAASDDALGGGGQNDQTMQAEDLLLNFGTDMYNNFYQDRYKGIARANAAIESLPNCGVEDKLAQYMGEAFFLRAWYYYELASMFGNIPCPVTTTADPTLPQISGEALWGQIIEDCKIAADIMPAKQATGDGHVDKYAAEALLGRAYLFASGFYGISDITLPAYENEAIGVSIAEGTKITKAEVGSYITDCVNNSGYTLVDDFHNLWAYTNRCSINDPKNPWAGKGYKWVEDDGARNPEALFVIKFNTQPSWDTTIGYSNQTCLFLGVRGQNADDYQLGNYVPFGVGWGMCPVSPAFVDDWKTLEPNDPRLDASIIPVGNFSGNYVFGGDSNIQESGYYQTKNMPVMAWSEDKGKYMATFTNVMFPDLTWSSGNEDNFQLNAVNDMVLIRFAEVLLMDAEINGNQASFDRVRNRAGLPSKPINDENLRNERRWELAFEGVRFNDLRRYGESYAVSALNKQEGVKVWNSGVEGTNNASKYNGGYGERYKATKGFVPLPSSQISLSAGAGEQYKFTQNEGWGSQFDYPGW
ncbi:MAG: RagB/SusD family nutrient uptake outer membrane protein [Bacteroidales bacterium]|nr:RagB/SusD family nutrient uptake outer membrane protein [Bacteroidales bacterium]MBQ5980148.1 RagB/SusD family nutrient uptake outer membrane protein [Bacteroidales bacterium]